jgi:hypothetical protein
MGTVGPTVAITLDLRATRRYTYAASPARREASSSAVTALANKSSGSGDKYPHSPIL